jgi:hypothetical protein
MSQVVKFTIDKISFDDGKTWSDVHFVDKSKYSPPEIHPTGGHGNIIKFTRDRKAIIK